MTYLIETESSKYVLRKLLGEGATCKCYLGQKIFDNKENSDSFAIKVFKPNFFPYYSNEVNILSKLSTNDNIIKLHEYGQGLISPLSKQENKDNVKEQKEKIFYEVMEYAVNGELNITHCDIKPENVLLDKYYRPLLNDFGFSQLFEGNNGDFTLHKFAGSNIYCAPETRKAYTRGFDAIKNDIFSLGVLLFVITIGDFPFINTSFSDEKYKFIIKKNYERFWEFFNNIEISDEFKDLINNLIGLNPSQRFTIDQILEHPWIKKYNKEINTNDQKALENNDIDQDVINEFNSRKV